MSSLNAKDLQKLAWTLEQLENLHEVGEAMRYWGAVHYAAGHFVDIPPETAEHHIILAAKIRDLAVVLHEVLESIITGEDKQEGGLQ